MPLLAPMFRMRPERFTTRSMGLAVAGEQAARIDAIIEAFFAGYNAMVSQPDLPGVREAVERLPPYFRPFAAEGAAMGYGPRHMLRPRAYRQFEQTMQQLGPQYLYLYYVGVGWWLGRLQPGRYRQGPIDRQIGHFDPRYYLLVYDGLGFSVSLLAPRQTESCRQRLLALQGDARQAALRGWGRSLWFVLRCDLEEAQQLVGGLEPAERQSCYAGLGLAAAFTGIDRPGEFFDALEQCPPEHRADFVTGGLFGWKSRRTCDPAYYEANLASLTPEQAAWQSRQMDRFDRTELILDRTPAYLPTWYRLLRQQLASER